MRVLSTFACVFGLVALGVISNAGAVSAEELVGTPVPIPAESTPIVTEITPPTTPTDPQSPSEEPTKMWQEFPHHVGENIQHHQWGEAHQDRFNPGEFVPLVTLILAIGGPLLLVGFIVSLRYRYRRQREQSINMNIDKLLAAGRDIPIELLRGDEPRSADHDDAEDSSLNKGIKNICIGLGILIFLWFIADINVASIAFILIGLGVSRVIVWKIAQPNKTQVQPNQPQD